MSFGSGGTYTQVSGAITAAAGQVIQSAVWNNIHTDLGNSLTSLGVCEVSPYFPRNIMSANGCLEVWQRGAGGSASIGVSASGTGYTADRWYLTTGANQASTVSQQPGIGLTSASCAQVQRNSGQTGATAMTFGYPLDVKELERMHGHKVSLTFDVATGANWSPTNGTLTATLYVGTGAPARRGGGFTNETNVLTIATDLGLAAPAAVKGGISTAVVPSNVTQGEVQFTWTPTGTAGIDDWFKVDEVMLDASQAPAQGFQVASEQTNFTFSLKQCKEHYWKSFTYATLPATGVGLGTGEVKGIASKAGAAAQFLWVRWPQSMRATPALSLTSPAVGASTQVYDEVAATNCSSTTYSQVSTEGATINTTGQPGTAVGNLLSIHITADAGI
jgi:hypothetical protein